MLTVMGLLSHPTFKELELISNDSGLYNSVTGTGIYEWESPEDISETFAEGEFVLTTLSRAQGDIKNVENELKALIEINVSGIAIKRVNFDHISDEILDYANRYNVPIFLFLETYIDDMIFTIRTLLETDDLNAMYLKKMRALMNGKSDDDTLRSLALEINPFFHDNHICCYFTCEDETHLEDIRNQLNQSHSEYLHGENNYYSIVRFPRGILLVFTFSDSADTCRCEVVDLIAFINNNLEDCHVGLSGIRNNLAQLRDTVNEAIYACIACIVKDQGFLEFSQIGLFKMLCPLHDDPWVNRYYDDYFPTLEEYDEIHGSDLRSTLITFMRFEGNISKTADALFQHKNTVRYRLDKIRSILEITDDGDNFSQLYVLTLIHWIKRTIEHLKN